MLKAWQYLQALSALPPRGSGTVGERRTAAWLGERLSEMGYEVEKQVFRSPVYTLYLGPLLVIAGLLIPLGPSAAGPVRRRCWGFCSSYPWWARCSVPK